MFAAVGPVTGSDAGAAAWAQTSAPWQLKRTTGRPAPIYSTLSTVWGVIFPSLKRRRTSLYCTGSAPGTFFL